MKVKTYISDNFLLQDELAERLFHETARDLPIVDFHNHLNPLLIAENTQPVNISQLWVMADQYKHRAMRINGIPEKYITGAATDKEKYQKWAETTPYTIGNPLHQWSHLELKRVFSIDKLLNESSAEEIWKNCNEQLAAGKHNVQNLLRRFKTEILCTSDELLDDVSVHQKASESGVRVLPSLRTDSILNFSGEFTGWLKRLTKLTSTPINNLESYESALRIRFNKFSEAGCRLADQALDAGFSFTKPDEAIAQKAFNKLLSGEEASFTENQHLTAHILCLIGKLTAEQNWTLQLHIGAQRSTSNRLKTLVGGAGGYAAIGTTTDIGSLVNLLNEIEKNGQLPNVILYNLNPIDNAAFATLTGSFSEDGISGKIQFGPAWWYNDHYEGILNQLKTQASHGLLGRSIGMTTDSRSFLSLSRHEYFRRILCRFLADWVEKGIMPPDEELLRKLISDISYNNSKSMLTNNL